MRQSRLILLLGCLGLGTFLSGCAQNGHVNLLGYTSEPVYDPGIRTVYVPIFKNVSFRRELEFDLTRAVIREIESNTPFKVVDCEEKADTVLLGKIVNWRKNVINVNPLNETREAEIGIAVELIWRDLRPGVSDVILSGPPGREGRPAPAVPVLVEPAATFIPELGGSRTSAEWLLINNLARGIIQKMEMATPY